MCCRWRWPRSSWPTRPREPPLWTRSQRLQWGKTANHTGGVRSLEVTDDGAARQPMGAHVCSLGPDAPPGCDPRI